VVKRDGKALIDLEDGLTSGLVVLVDVANGDLTDHDARLGGGAVERLSGHDDHAQAIVMTLLIVVEMFIDSNGDQTLFCRMIDEGGLQQVCNHRVQTGVLADAEHWEQDVNGTILATGDQAGLFETGLETYLIDDEVISLWTFLSFFGFFPSLCQNCKEKVSKIAIFRQ
jgi:hypothetical protein